MSKNVAIGLVVPFETDKVPEEGLAMYPDARFIPRGVGVRSLTPEGYDVAWAKIHAATDALAQEGAAAIMVIGTSLTFYRGYEAHEKLMEDIRMRTGLPVSTMSKAVVDGLKFFGARQVGVCTAYNDEVNRRLSEFLKASGFEVLALEGFGISGFGEAETKSEQDIIALSGKVCGEAPDAEGLLISCGGLRTLGVARPIEAEYGIPVVSSTQAAFWAAMRLVGDSGYVAGCGQLLERAVTPVH